MDREENKRIELLLNEAESLLYKDIEKELKELEKGVYPPIINPEKYEEVKEIFEQILVEDPENERAKEGLKACNDMLESYHPEQHLMVPPSLGLNLDLDPRSSGYSPDIVLREPISKVDHKRNEGLEKKEETQIGKKLKPWEVRRTKLEQLKASDKAGLKYTAEVFSAESEKAENKVWEIINRAKSQIEDAGIDFVKVYEEAEEELKAFQKKLNREWKGHGPNILDSGLLELKKQIKFE